MIKRRVELSKLTTIHLSGWIDVNVIENDKDILSIRGSSVIIGGGSNLLIKNSEKTFYKLSKKFSYSRIEGDVLVCGGALSIANLMKFSINNGISSLEFLAGVPATVGGAVFMNAGAFGESVKDKILYIKVACMHSGIKNIDSSEAKFGYRKSGLENCIVLEAGFRYNILNKFEISEKIRNNIKKRVEKAHLSNTFGSVFKNPDGDFAGRLIEESGLKGFRKGSAVISSKHANFILGSKKTEVDDVLFLIDKAKDMVFKNFSVELEEEVRII